MSPWRKVDVVPPKHELERDDSETKEDAGSQTVNLGPGVHQQRHDEQRDERSGAFQEKAERLAFHLRRF